METSLKNILDEKEKYNLALPFVETQQINPYYKLSVALVSVDTREQAGNIFKCGQKCVRQDGKDIWTDLYALTKPFLQRLATESGIQFNPMVGDVVKMDKNTWKASASGAIKLPDGTIRTSFNHKVIDLLTEERKYKLAYEDKAEHGITDFRAAKDASTKYAGEWIDTGDRNEKGYPIRKYVVDEKERIKYIEGSLLEAMAQLRANAPQKATTGAILRVIRDLLGIKGTYTMDELKKPFAVARMSFSPDYNDPLIKQMMLQQCLQSMGNLFGNLPATMQTISLPQSESEPDPESEENWFDAPDQQPSEKIVSEPVLVPEADDRSVDYQCDKCGVVVPKNVWNYSYEKFGRPLCLKCQREERGRR